MEKTWEDKTFFPPSLFLVTTTHAVGRQWAAEGCVWLGYKDPRGDRDKACGLALTLQQHIQHVTALKCNPNRVRTGTRLPFTAAYMFMCMREREREIEETGYNVEKTFFPSYLWLASYHVLCLFKTKNEHVWTCAVACGLFMWCFACCCTIYKTAMLSYSTVQNFAVKYI